MESTNHNGLLSLIAVALLAGGATFAVSGCSAPADGSGEIPRAITSDWATNPELYSGGEEMATGKTQREVIHADEADFDQLVLQSDVPVLVDFFADWCRPCQMLAPTLEEIARETPNARVVKVNVDHSPKLAARYSVSSIPSLKVFKDGEVVAQHVGMASKDHLKGLLGG